MIAYKYADAGRYANMLDSSPTMARRSAAKEANNSQTNFMAPGGPNPQVSYGTPQIAYG